MQYKTLCASVLASLLLCGSLTGCGAGMTMQADNLTAKVKPQLASGTTPDETFEKAQTAFALHLMQETVKTQPGKNLLLSPYSLMQVLAMSANGAAGETLAELEQALGGIPAETLSSYLYGQRTSLPVGAGNQLKTVNSLWVHYDADRIVLRGTFVQKSVDYFGADIYCAPFDESTRSDINNWCSEKTDGVIPEILSEPIDPNAVLYLVNAVNFDAKWEEKYEDEPREMMFHAKSGALPSVQMMFSEESVYLSDAQAEGFLKPYKGGIYAFVGILPKNGMTPEEYLAQTDADALYGLLQNAQHASVKAGLPEFTCDWGAELIPVLQNMGIRTAFQDAADFSGMNAVDNPVAISKVLQKTHIEVDVNGTKAQAISLSETQDSAAPPPPEYTVILDRPFLYMIVETDTMMPVFAGVMNEFAS